MQHFSSLAFIHKVWGGLSSKIEWLGITYQLDLVLALSGQLVGFAQAQAWCLETDVAVCEHATKWLNIWPCNSEAP